MKLEILTPEKTLYSGKINSIHLPGSMGSFTVLHNHAPIISTLVKGQIKIITEDKKTELIDILGGIAEVKRNSIIVLTDIF